MAAPFDLSGGQSRVKPLAGHSLALLTWVLSRCLTERVIRAPIFRSVQEFQQGVNYALQAVGRELFLFRFMRMKLISRFLA